MLEVAAILKVSALKKWMNADYLKEYYKGGIDSIVEVLIHFSLEKPSKEDLIQNQTLKTPSLKTTESSNSILEELFSFNSEDNEIMKNYSSNLEASKISEKLSKTMK